VIASTGIYALTSLIGPLSQNVAQLRTSSQKWPVEVGADCVRAAVGRGDCRFARVVGVLETVGIGEVGGAADAVAGI
jgi:hypothetical protein